MFRLYKYLNELLGYSIIGTKSIEYNEGSDYVEKFKTTTDFTNLKSIMKSNLERGKSEYNGSLQSIDEFVDLTLGKYNYKVEVIENDSYYNINLQLSDTFNFNEEKYDGSFLNNYLNVLHKANDYGILTPVDINININYKIYEK